MQLAAEKNDTQLGAYTKCRQFSQYVWHAPGMQWKNYTHRVFHGLATS